MSNAQPNPVTERMRAAVDWIISEYGHNKRTIAGNVGIAQSSLTQLLSGRTATPSRRTIILLRDRYGVNPDYIMMRSDEVAMPDAPYRGIVASLRGGASALPSSADRAIAGMDEMETLLSELMMKETEAKIRLTRRIIELQDENRRLRAENEQLQQRKKK